MQGAAGILGETLQAGMQGAAGILGEKVQAGMQAAAGIHAEKLGDRLIIVAIIVCFTWLIVVRE